MSFFIKMINVPAPFIRFWKELLTPFWKRWRKDAKLGHRSMWRKMYGSEGENDEAKVAWGVFCRPYWIQTLGTTTSLCHFMGIKAITLTSREVVHVRVGDMWNTEDNYERLGIIVLGMWPHFICKAHTESRTIFAIIVKNMVRSWNVLKHTSITNCLLLKHNKYFAMTGMHFQQRHLRWKFFSCLQKNVKLDFISVSVMQSARKQYVINTSFGEREAKRKSFWRCKCIPTFFAS